jgi:hypothetical protein
VATEIVRTLVGSIGLVASVPLTTWLAVSVVGNGDTTPTVRSGERPPKRRGSGKYPSSAAEDGSDAHLAAVPTTAELDSSEPDQPKPRRSRWSNLRDGIDD